MAAGSRALSVVDSLDEALKAQVERAAFAVNQAWSLFATWGGRGGYGDLPEETGFGIGGIGTCGCGDGGISDSFGIRVATIKLDLRAQFARGIDACRRGQRVAIDIETTREEIVDVGVEVSPADREVHDCVVEAVWNTMIAIPNAPEHATTRFVFDPS